MFMKRLFSILFSVSAVLMLGICLYAGAFPYGISSGAQGDLLNYSRDWIDSQYKVPVSIDGTNYSDGINSVTVSKTLPDTLPEDAVLFMQSNHNEVSSFVNGREIFCEGVCRDRTFGITYTGIWVIIPLQESDAGQTITLQIQKTDGNQGQLPSELLLANRHALMSKLAQQSVFPIVIAVFMIALSVGLFIAGILLKKQKERYANRTMIWLSLFILMSGVWMLIDDNVPCLFGSYNDAWYFLSFYCFMLLPVPFVRFIGECMPKSGKVMLLFSGGFMLSFLLSVTAAVFFSKPLSLLLPMTHILVFAGLAVTLYYAWQDRNDNGKLRMPELFWGLCLFAAAMIGALAAFYFGAISTYALLFRTATLMFVGALSIFTIRRSISEIQQARQFEQLTQTIPSGISRISSRDDFPILYGNDTYYRMFGYEPEEAKAVGFDHFDFMLLEEDREQLHRELTEKVKNNELNFEIEARARHKSGKTMYMLTANNYLPDKGEIVSVLTDITLRKSFEEQLRIQGLEFRIAAEQSDKYIMRYDIKTRRLYSHRKAVRRFGVAEVCENAEQSLIDLNFIGKSSVEKHLELYRKIHRGDERGSAVLQLYARDLSEFRWYHVDFTLVYDQEHKPDQAVISFYDITQQREKELAYERLRQEAESVPSQQITTFACNLTRNVIDESAGHLINNLASDQNFDAYTETYSSLAHPDDRQALRQLMDCTGLTKQFQNGIFSHKLEFRMKFGENYRWLQLSIQVVKYADNDDLKAFVAVLDIDAKKNSELSLIQRSETDALTGIMNRAAYAGAINALIARQGHQRHVLIMMDVDHFKDVNDTLGHDMGDQVLRQVAADLRKTLREGDLLGRLGGDEFSFCFVNLSDEEVLKAMLERVRSVLNHDIGGGIYQSVSIGAAVFDGSAGDFVEVYKNADIALYQAKKNGRNQFALFNQ
ncbi:MAG: diguanylate cyclase [Erysipelotrichia bacterium]|nr:diguanylate cyclase [Erysipelotrichia bacterium]